VAGVIGDALSRIVGAEVDITCAGRTDKGVHGFGQVIHVDVPVGSYDLHLLGRSLNRMCAPSIAIRAVDEVDESFDARFSATARRYRYLVRNAPFPDPTAVNSSWFVDEPLSLSAMTLGCDPFIGEHDFSAFCRRPKRTDGHEASLVRRVIEATWHDDGQGRLRFEIEASAFCHQMVRSVVGTLVDVGRGRIRPGELVGIIASGDRSAAGQLAPPQGLTLQTVRYGSWSSDSVDYQWSTFNHRSENAN